MTECVHIPQGPLADVVAFIWYQNGYQPSGPVERILPGGSSQIIINLHGQRFRHFSSNLKKRYEYDEWVLTGMHGRPVFLDAHTRISTINVVLKEGAIPALFNIPAVECRDEVVSLRDLSPVNLGELKDQLYASSRPEDKFLAVESYLYQLLDFRRSPNPAAGFAVDQIRRTNGHIDIAGIVDQTGYSNRWFINQFRDSVGTTPKQFARICRFQHALDLLRKEAAPNYAEIALQCGYYDQSHFIHDFKHLGGISPSDYHRHRGEAKNHLVMQPA